MNKNQHKQDKFNKSLKKIATTKPKVEKRTKETNNQQKKTTKK